MRCQGVCICLSNRKGYLYAVAECSMLQGGGELSECVFKHNFDGHADPSPLLGRPNLNQWEWQDTGSKQ